MRETPEQELGRRAYGLFVAQFAALELPGLRMKVDKAEDDRYAVRGSWLHRQAEDNVASFSTVMDGLSKGAADKLLRDILKIRMNH